MNQKSGAYQLEQGKRESTKQGNQAGNGPTTHRFCIGIGQITAPLSQLSAPLFTEDRYSTSTDNDQDNCDAEVSNTITSD